VLAPGKRPNFRAILRHSYRLDLARIPHPKVARISPATNGTDRRDVSDPRDGPG